MQDNKDPMDIWGPNLEMVFGPVNERRHISELTYDEKMELVNSVPRYVSTSELGKFPSFYAIVNKILQELAQSGVFQGIDLDWQEPNAIIKSGMVRPWDAYKPTSMMYKNNKVQRGIQLRHLLMDILFRFDPQQVLGGLARKSVGEEKYYMNDAQHRNVACIILGIRELPVEYQESDFESVDVQQYGCVNINSLVASEFDKWRNRTQMVITSLDEDRDIEDLGPEYKTAYAVWEIVEQQCGITIVEKYSKSERMTCSGIANLVRDYERYGTDIFERAVRIISNVFSKTPYIPAQSIEMVCKFLETQRGVATGDVLVNMAISKGIRHWDPKGTRNGLHVEAKRACDNGKGGEDNLNLFTEQDLQLKYASGLLKLVREVSPEIDWVPILIKGHDIAKDLMEDFIFMPVQSNQAIAAE
jgi:hypothetical protein